MSDITLPPPRASDEELMAFAEALQAFPVPFELSARGWGYQLEDAGLITKAEFDYVENLINKCRKKGFLPLDFIAEEEGRKFSGVETPDTETPIEFMKGYLEAVLDCDDYYTPDWWDGEEYYIQMLVEKIDLKTLFEPICREYHIAIATSKGWSSMLQRGEYAKRFMKAEKKGLKCVLEYCGDHDPDGLRISDFLRENLYDLQEIVWKDGTPGYDPTNLEIHRFGLDYDFIKKNNLTWIDNLITGSGKNLASPSHKNYHMPYVQNYLKQFGIRKCEANALVVRPDAARQLCRNAIEHWLGGNAINRFKRKRDAVHKQLEEMREKTGLKEAVAEALDAIEAQEEEDEDGKD